MTNQTPANPLAMLLDAIQIIRTKDAEMTAQAMSLLLSVYLEPGTTMTRLMGSLDLSNTAVSRNIHKFLAKNDGLGLIRQEEDAADSRVKHLYLTRDGEILMERLRTLLA